MQFGVANEGGPSLDETLAVGDVVGTTPDAVLWYEAFTIPDFPAEAADRLVAGGFTPMVTWEPWDPARGLSQPEFRLAAIAAGRHDAYLRRWSGQIAAWGHPLLLRFAHEMNGDWYPWSELVNGNTPGTYVAAWRHVHDVVRASGATNVRWVWSPNVAYPGSQPMRALYPGAEYVDWVALDGYNWGTVEADSLWQSFLEIFGDSLAEIRRTAPGKPLMIGEVGSTERGGDKAAWVSDFLAALPQLSQTYGLRAFFWFNLNKETDWRFASSESSRLAFRNGSMSRLVLGATNCPQGQDRRAARAAAGWPGHRPADLDPGPGSGE